MHWRLIIDGPRDGAANMARDQALFEGVQAGGRPVLRLYRWDPPCLSLGRNQRAIGVYDATLARSAGVDIVRRPTGGLAVYHDREITYAVAVPVGVIGGPRAAYAAINRALARALVRLGVRATMHTAHARLESRRLATAAIGPDAIALPWRDASAVVPCFTEAAEGEVVADGRKLIGSAQRCEHRTLLQHGSILLDGDQSPVVRLQAGGGAAPASIGITQLIGRTPADDEMHDAIVAGFHDACGIVLDRVDASAAESARVPALERHFRSTMWTWRR